MGIESNKEAYQTMKNSIGSMENRMREIYNKGYRDGIKEGINRAMQKIADSILEEVEADRKTENSSEIPNGSEKPNNCECEPRKEQNFCDKCRYLYRDFKYGLSCYRLMDNEPCKYEERKTENSSEKPNNCEHITEDGVTCAKYPACDDCLDNPLNKLKGSERLVKGSEKPNNCEELQDWKDRMWAEAIVTEPTISKMEQVDEPKTQTKTQNSNLTFEKRTMRDCYNCKRYETEGE